MRQNLTDARLTAQKNNCIICLVQQYKTAGGIAAPGLWRGIRVLAVSHLTKIYHKTPANNDISFNAEPGQVTILLGPNGAGKSTAIKCIMGLLRYRGEITVCGKPNKTLEAKAALGYVPEVPSLYDLLTVGEHMELMARAYRLTGYEAYAQELLERFELKDKESKLARELSKGMQQKVSICCALLHRPKIVVFDEPLVGLDPHAIKEIKKTFSELRGEGRSVLISTHIIDSVQDIWDKAVILSQGSILRELTREQAEAEGVSLEDAFFRLTERDGDN